MTQRQIGYYAVKGPLKANKQTNPNNNKPTNQKQRLWFRCSLF